MAGPLDDLKQSLRAFGPACEQAEVVLKIRDQARAVIADGERVADLVLRENELRRAYEELQGLYDAKVEGLRVQYEAEQRRVAAPVEAAKAEAEQRRAQIKNETVSYIAAREAERLAAQTALDRVQRELHATRTEVVTAREEAKRVAAEEEQAAERRRKAIREENAALELRNQELKREEAEIRQRLEAMVRRG